MPFVTNMNGPQDDENKKTPNQGGGAVHLAPTGAVPAGGTGSAGPSSAKAGGQFASLDQYLTANQGRAEPLAGKITEGIGKEYQGLEGQNQQVLSGIGNQVSSSAVAPNSNAVIAEEAANPSTFASDPNKVASFQNLLKASYTGPLSAEGTNEYAGQQAAINKAIAQGQQSVKTESGRENLLAKNEARPTTGVTALNSAILSKSPDALKTVESAYTPFSNLLGGLSSGAQDVNKNIAQTKTGVETANKAANKQIADQVTALNSGLTSRASEAATNQNARNTAIQEAQGRLAPLSTNINSLNELLDKYFPSASRVSNPMKDLMGMTVSNNLYTPESLATTDEAARGQAFQALLNGVNTEAPMPLVTQAGTLTAPEQFTSPISTDIANQVDQTLTPIQFGQGQNQNLLKNYQDTLNWQQQIKPVFDQLLQSLNKLNPTIWAPPA